MPKVVNKKGFLVTDYLIIILILIGLLALVSFIYFGLSGKLPNLISQIRNLFRFGN